MLNNQSVTEILHDWSVSNRQTNLNLPREITLPDELYTDLVLIIQGVRRCGKSTLLNQLPKKYTLALSNCFFCNFEDPRLLGALDHNLLNQIVSIARQEVNEKDPCYFFFDEIQNVKNWEKWMHVQLEKRKNNYFVVTGSNSCLLSGEFATALTGRHLTVELFPFSLSEFQSLLPNKTFEDYLLSGGFPRSLTFPQPYHLLQEYFNDIILRDVLKRVHARTPDAIKQVVKMTFDSCGSELSYRKIAVTTGLTVDTVKAYLEACEQAYLLFSCPFFAFSEKKRAIKQKKYYPIDVGLRYAITSTNHRDLGKSLEILVFLHLKKKYKNIYYWQETHRGEVDFIITEGNNIIPYQVTWQEPEPHHHKALDNFYATFPQANEAIFITKENAKDFLKS